MGNFRFGINMGALKAEFEKNPADVLREISKIGYKGIEIGYPLPLPVDEFNSLVKELDLEVISVGAVKPESEDELNKLIEFLQAINCKRIIFGIFWLWELNSADDYKRQAEICNKLGERFNKHGIRYFYHNHNWEFDKFDGKYGMDIMIEETNPEWVSVQFDTCWMMVGGVDPLEYIHKHESRCRLIHFKDVILTDSGKKYKFTEAGTGVVDFKKIHNGVNPKYIDWLISEQDNSTLPIMETVRINYENYKRLGVV